MISKFLGMVVVFAWAASAGAQTIVPPRTGALLLGDRANNNVLYIKDLNLDRDYADPGEIFTWYAGLNGIVPTTLQDLAVGSDGTIYLSDSGTDTILALVDGDPTVFPPSLPNGNADDPGESRVYFSNSGALGTIFAGPGGICVTQGTTADVLWIPNSSNGALAFDRLLRCEDLNGDGDALDVGEAVVWWEKTTSIVNGGPDLDNPNAVIVDPYGQVLLVHGSGNGATRGVYRLLDLGGTPGANDPGEVNLYYPFPNFGTTTPSPFVFCAQASRNGDLYFADRGTPDTLYALRDLNLDGDATDPGEATPYYSPTGSSLVDNLVEYVEYDGTTVILLAEDQTPDRLIRLLDIDGSGTINLPIEVSTVYDDTLPGVYSIGQPKAIEAMPAPFLSGPNQIVPGQQLTFTHASVRGHTLVMAFDLVSYPQIFAPYGLLELSPFAQVFLPFDIVPASGTYTFTTATPAVSALSGLVVYIQSADFDGISGSLSNLYTVTFL